MDTLTARARLLALVTLEAAAVAALHGVGGGLVVDWADPAAWLAATAPADAAVAGLRYAGLAAGWWLLAGTAGYLLARAARLPRTAAAAARLTLPAVRHLVDRALAAGAAASLALAGPAPALADVVLPPAVTTPAGPEAPGDVVVPPAVAAPAGSQGTRDVGPVPAPGTAPLAAAPAAAPADEPEPAEHVVAAGEHLWSIAAAAVAAASGRDPAEVTAAEVAPYWVRLVEANRDRLRSGDPDLVYPGERLTLPRSS